MPLKDGLPDRLKAAREATGMSQGDLALTLCVMTGTSTLTRHDVSRWERGKRRPTAWVSALAIALDVTVSYLEEGPPRPTAEEPDSDALELLRRLHMAQAVDRELVALLACETDMIRVIDRRLGVVAASGKLRAHIDQVEEALRYSVRSDIRTELAGTLADASTLAGWQAIDAGTSTVAWHHFEQAKAAAREAEDAALLAHAAGEQAYVLSDLQNGDAALQLVTSAYTDAVPARLRVWLLMAKAEIAACARDERACREALTDADSLLPRIGDDPALPYLFIDGPHLMRWRGNCLARFGDPGTVGELEVALDGMEPGTFNRAEAGLRCDLATALIAQNELGEARNQAVRAAELAALTGSVRQRRRVTAVNARLTSGAA